MAAETKIDGICAILDGGQEARSISRGRKQLRLETVLDWRRLQS